MEYLTFVIFSHTTAYKAGLVASRLDHGKPYPTWSILIPHGTCLSHMAHSYPTWHMLIPHGTFLSHMTHAYPTWGMLIPHV